MPHLLGRDRVTLNRGVAPRMAAEREFGSDTQARGKLDHLIGRANLERLQQAPGQFQTTGPENALAHPRQ